jgi:hypothetical protein
MQVGQSVKLKYNTDGLGTRCLGNVSDNRIGKILAISRGLATVVSKQKANEYFLEELNHYVEPVANDQSSLLVARLTNTKRELEDLLAYIDLNIKNKLGSQKGDLGARLQAANPAEGRRIRGEISEIDSLLGPLLGMIGYRENNAEKTTIRGHLKQAVSIKTAHNSKQALSAVVKAKYSSMIDTLNADMIRLKGLIQNKKVSSVLLKGLLSRINLEGGKTRRNRRSKRSTLKAPVRR